jgi:hypothetical protein
MPAFGPISRRRFIRIMKRTFGWEGPFPGGKHEYLTKDGIDLTLPNPHRGDIGVQLLSALLQQAGISREEWERA